MLKCPIPTAWNPRHSTSFSRMSSSGNSTNSKSPHCLGLRNTTPVMKQIAHHLRSWDFLISPSRNLRIYTIPSKLKTREKPRHRSLFRIACMGFPLNLKSSTVSNVALPKATRKPAGSYKRWDVGPRRLVPMQQIPKDNGQSDMATNQRNPRKCVWFSCFHFWLPGKS